MRDVMTVNYGDDVTVTEGQFVHRAGIFRGVARNAIVVDLHHSIMHVPFNHPHLSVLDTWGRELGFVEPDPPLPTVTPDLE